MTLRILNVAYPFAPVGPDAVGGAEQILARIDEGLTARGHCSFVLGCEGSRSSGQLFRAFHLPASITEEWRRKAYERYREAIETVIDTESIDLVHLHGVDFYEYLPRRTVPVLATLHLPPAWYPPEILQKPPPNVWFNCVSTPQQDACPQSPQFLAPVANGVRIPELSARTKSSFALSLGRICPEKGYHLGIEAAAQAGVPFVLGGEVFPYPAHLEYFARHIQPRQGRHCRFLGPLRGPRKLRYLQKARCLLIPSLVAETSSLVAMEALACGTPVVAFKNGALPSLIEHGKTGFLASDETEMAEAIRWIDQISPDYCRAEAMKRFSVTHMTEQYLARYRQLTERFRNKQPYAEFGSTAA